MQTFKTLLQKWYHWVSKCTLAPIISVATLSSVPKSSARPILTPCSRIILHVNSPGGSPVQSSYVYDEIRKIKSNHPDLPIYAVASDICASGCYFIISAADKIFVNPSSLIGSIGVIMDG
jgi:ATP-dependent protease ClpP protease subunit